MRERMSQMRIDAMRHKGEAFDAKNEPVSQLYMQTALLYAIFELTDAIRGEYT